EDRRACDDLFAEPGGRSCNEPVFLAPCLGICNPARSSATSARPMPRPARAPHSAAPSSCQKRCAPAPNRGSLGLSRRERAASMRKRFQRRFDLKRTLFILPNLITLSSVFCGFDAIRLAGGAEGEDDLYRAALLIIFAMFFDTLDGRVAR